MAPGWLSRETGGVRMMPDARETGVWAWGPSDGAAARSAARLLPSRQQQAPVTKSITLTKSQIEGRERIRQYKVQQRPTHKPAKKGRVSRLRDGLEPAGDPEGIPCGAYGQCVVCWTDVGGATVWLRRSSLVPPCYPGGDFVPVTVQPGDGRRGLPVRIS